MPPKRLRRASPTAQGLSAGERLKRAKLSGQDYLAWAWVGTEVLAPKEITREHRASTCGFSDASSPPFCVNRYRESANKQPEQQKLNGTAKTAGELEDDIIVVSDDDTPTCSIKACRNNPNCLNYLGQEKWENEEKARDAFMKAENLGENPHNDIRPPQTPVGLKNLGATCYANAFLQVWFQDLPFRSGVFNCQPTPSDQKFEEAPVFQLQVTFAAMQFLKQSAFNPVKLVESLKLRTTEQQDAQEFSKLFMAHLDSEFQKQSDPGLKSLIADQFQGKEVYATVCSRCHNRSERENEFLEIEVNLANNCTLEERIAALLRPEDLNGDNQYLCSHCDSLQDAQRLTELTELPPVLHFSLLRFVYDLSTMERKKSKQAISFPQTIDMGQFLKANRDDTCTGRSSEFKYHLRGVLLHKGPSAYHGHYEAQVFDVGTRSWYQFNDETVTKIGSLFPERKSPPKGSQNGSQPLKVAKSKVSAMKKKSVKVDSDIEILEDVKSSQSEPSPASEERSMSSRDAYMLIYARDLSDNGLSQDSTDMTQSATNGKGKTVDLIATPPRRALEVVETLNREHDETCENYAVKQQEMEARFTEIRRRVMDIYRSWELSNNQEDNVVVSKQALESWLGRHLVSRSKKGKEVKPEPDGMDIDSDSNTISCHDVICTHGRLDPGKTPNMKRIKRAAYDRIVSADGCQLSPVLGSQDVCAECVESSFTERLYQIEHPRLVTLFDQVCPVDDEQQCAYWISKQWLKDWRLAKPKMHNPSQEDPPPDSAEYSVHVRCEHGGLTPNVIYRKRISEEAHELLKSLFPDWITLTTNDEHCAVCEALVHISKEDRRGARIQAEDEKAKLKHMHENALNGSIKLLENVPCAIVPAQFVRAWKQWLFRPAELPRPDGVDNAQYICQHGLLTLDPNITNDMDSNVAVITRNDWNILECLYPGGPLIELEHDGSRWIHSPEVCEDCRKERKSSYDMTELTIRILRAEDPVPTPDTYAARTSEKQETTQTTLITYSRRTVGTLRQSKRIRQVKELGQRRRKITVTRTMTVKDLKILIQDELDIPTISQRLYYEGNELEDNAQTIGSLGVLSNDAMDLREETEDVDLLGSNAEPKKREEGQGFGGTLLGSSRPPSSTPHSSEHEDEPDPGRTSRSCPACTFDNTLDAFACAMCDSVLDDSLI